MSWKAESAYPGPFFSRAKFFIHPNYITLKDIELRLTAQNNIANVSIVYDDKKVCRIYALCYRVNAAPHVGI